MKLIDIAYLVFAVPLSLWLIWELIPDPAKKYLGYLRMVRQDRKSGKSRTYIFSFRNGLRRK